MTRRALGGRLLLAGLLPVLAAARKDPKAWDEADALVAAGDYAGAIERFDLAVKRAPKYARWSVGAGRCQGEAMLEPDDRRAIEAIDACEFYYRSPGAWELVRRRVPPDAVVDWLAADPKARFAAYARYARIGKYERHDDEPRFEARDLWTTALAARGESDARALCAVVEVNRQKHPTGPGMDWLGEEAEACEERLRPPPLAERLSPQVVLGYSREEIRKVASDVRRMRSGADEATTAEVDRLARIAGEALVDAGRYTEARDLARAAAIEDVLVAAALKELGSPLAEGHAPASVTALAVCTEVTGADALAACAEWVRPLMHRWVEQRRYEWALDVARYAGPGGADEAARIREAASEAAVAVWRDLEAHPAASVALATMAARYGVDLPARGPAPRQAHRPRLEIVVPNPDACQRFAGGVRGSADSGYRFTVSLEGCRIVEDGGCWTTRTAVEGRTYTREYTDWTGRYEVREQVRMPDEVITEVHCTDRIVTANAYGTLTQDGSTGTESPSGELFWQRVELALGDDYWDAGIAALQDGLWAKLEEVAAVETEAERREHERAGEAALREGRREEALDRFARAWLLGGSAMGVAKVLAEHWGFDETSAFLALHRSGAPGR